MIPDLLSVARLLTAAPLAWALLHEAPGLAALLLALAVASDLLDGPLARRTRGETERGRWLDHLADFAVVSAGLAACAWRGLVPLALPILVALAFAQYAIDSRWLPGGRGLRMSWLGRCNGVAYFVPLVGAILVELGLGELAVAVRALAWLLVATTLLSIADRLRALAARAAAPAAPAAGTADRSRR